MPQDERMITTPVRVAFTKTGSLAFISHLDLMRTVTRILIRADIGIYYTEGYNPHPKLVFALPLSVGTESVTELFDIKVCGDSPDYEEILRRLRREAPSELHITDVYAPEGKYRDIAFAEYEIVIHSDDMPTDAEAVAAEMMSAPIVLMKRTKSGETECDIRPFIHAFEARLEEDDLYIVTRLAADPEHYLNPEYVVTAVTRALGLGMTNIAPGGDAYTIMRTVIYRRDGEKFR